MCVPFNYLVSLGIYKADIRRKYHDRENTETLIKKKPERTEDWANYGCPVVTNFISSERRLKENQLLLNESPSLVLANLIQKTQGDVFIIYCLSKCIHCHYKKISQSDICDYLPFPTCRNICSR